MMRHGVSIAVACGACFLAAPAGAGAGARARDVELAAQSLGTLAVDDETRGGGVGLGIEAALPIAERPLGVAGRLLAFGSIAALVGSGWAWGFEAGAAYRFDTQGRWQPQTGLSLLWLTGDLVRTIDEHGHVAADPWALRGGVAPLRFELDDGWVSALELRAGPTLFRSGAPPLAVSIVLFEVGVVL